MATPSSPLTDLGRAVADAIPGTQSRGGPGIRSRRHVPLSPMGAEHPIVQAVGTRIHVRDAGVLLSMVGGTQHSLGRCMITRTQGGRRWEQAVTFDFWFPHLNIAVDEGVPKRDDLMATGPRAVGRAAAHPRRKRPRRTDEEIEAKFAWCRARGIAYAAPDDNDLDALRTIAAGRRGEVQH